MSTHEPEKKRALDAEYLAGHRFPYQEDIALVDDIDLLEATPGEDINWLEDVELLEEDGVPAVFDRYSNAFLKIYFDIPAGREDEIARKVLVKHLTSGNSYGIQLKADHTKFPQPELGPWVDGSKTVVKFDAIDDQNVVGGLALREKINVFQSQIAMSVARHAA